jgi:hypothetical protein
MFRIGTPFAGRDRWPMQVGRSVHAESVDNCYPPLYVLRGRHLFVSKQRRSNIDAAAGSVADSKASAEQQDGVGRGR